MDSTSNSSLLYVVDGLVLNGSDEDLKEFEKSRASAFTTTGVAVCLSSSMEAQTPLLTSLKGAVFSQVSITALALPSIDTTHWVTKGLWVIALTYGIFTVEFSVSQQAQLSNWLDPKETRRRLSYSVTDEATGEKCTGAAIDTILNLTYPGRGLSFSSMAFVLGLAVYLGTSWTSGGNNLPGPDDTRNVFLCFIGCIVFEFAWAIIIAIVICENDMQQEEEEEVEEETGSGKTGGEETEAGMAAAP